MRFKEFKVSNEDIFGWWHVSCDYAFQQRAKGRLFNTLLEERVDASLAGLPKYYPQ